MAIASSEWLDLIGREYVLDFISHGGSATKFAVGDDSLLASIRGKLAELSASQHLSYVTIDAAITKLHMIQDIFFAVARMLDWEEMAQHFVESLFTRQGYEWPHPGQAAPIHEIAQHNRIDLTLVRRDFRRWLSTEIMRDNEMTQDFRVAATRLCLRRLEAEDGVSGITSPVLQWLRGELRRLGDLNGTSITSKITRHNGRAMLRSLCRWVQLCGRRGICLTLDVRQLAKTGAVARRGREIQPRGGDGCLRGAAATDRRGRAVPWVASGRGGG